MYKSEVFCSMDKLLMFLNRKNIPKENIVSIIPSQTNISGTVFGALASFTGNTVWYELVYWEPKQEVAK